MENNVKIQEVMTLAEAAAFIRVSERTLGQMAREGRIPAQKAGREWRFLRRALEDWLARGGPAVGEGHPTSRRPAPTTGRLFGDHATGKRSGKTGFADSAFTENRDEQMHRWVPWIAGFSAAFVNDVLDQLPRGRRALVLDPFAGVGTTLVEGVRRGHDVVGYEINPYAALACRMKLMALELDADQLLQRSAAFTEFVAESTADAGRVPGQKAPPNFVSRVPFFSPRVERQVLFALDFIASESDPIVADFLRVAVGATMVGYSNYSYEPSLSRRSVAGKQDVLDCDVAGVLAAKLYEMCSDIAGFQVGVQRLGRKGKPRADVYPESYLDSDGRVAPSSVDVVVTSPPYLNNYHYVRNTRPQLYWLGIVTSNSDLKAMEQTSFGKFWQTVRAGPEVKLEMRYPKLASVIARLSEENRGRGVYGGRGWANYAATYFNDCVRFCQRTIELMKPGGLVVVVIGNNILQGVEVRTDEFFAGIAEMCGCRVAGMHRVRKKRTGTSIINSSVRAGKVKQRTELYETAIELRVGAT